MSRSYQQKLFYCWWRTKAIDDCSNSNSKRFEICQQLLSSLTLCLCETGVNTTFRLFESRLTSDYLQMTLNGSTIFVADMVIHFGRYGLFVWPMWLWPIWSVADMVQTRAARVLRTALLVGTCGMNRNEVAAYSRYTTGCSRKKPNKV